MLNTKGNILKELNYLLISIEVNLRNSEIIEILNSMDDGIWYLYT